MFNSSSTSLLLLTLMVISEGENAAKPDVHLDEPRQTISQRFADLQDNPFYGSVTTQWAHLIQRELRNLTYDDAARLARQWCDEGGGFTAFVASMASESIDPPNHVKFVKYQFDRDNTVAVSDDTTRILTPSTDVMKREGLIDVTLPGERIVSKPVVEKLRFHPPTRLPLVAQTIENLETQVRLQYHSAEGRQTIECTVDNRGFISTWTQTPDGDHAPNFIVLQSGRITVTQGYFPKRAVRLKFRNSVLYSFNVYEILDVTEGEEISAESLLVSVPKNSAVIDDRGNGPQKVVIAKTDLPNWNEAFDLSKNREALPKRNTRRILYANLIVIASIAFVAWFRSRRFAKNKKES